MNFCAACMNPEITSSKPGADGREVKNLVSEDPALRRKGFMAEYFIRPPLDISLVLPVPIHISHIIINSRVDHMISNGFFVFTRLDDTESDSESQNVKSESKSESSKVNADNKHLIDKSSSEKEVQKEHLNDGKPDFDDVYFCVGKYFTKSEEKLILRNPHYQHWLNIPMPAINKESNPLEYKGTMRHPNRQVLRSVKSILLRIICTAERGPPVIQNLEVWGQPSITTCKSQKKILLNKWKSRKQENHSMPIIPRLYNSEPEEVPSTSAVSDSRTTITEDSLDVPEDFLDPLTCEVMSVPLMMPSSHSIDARTLEKYIANEAIWGRPPSDPFTGVPFKRGSQPAPNVPLKARIDRFLILHGDHHEVKKIGRTVGSASNAYGHWKLNYKNEESSPSHSTKRKNELQDDQTNKIPKSTHSIAANIVKHSSTGARKDSPSTSEKSNAAASINHKRNANIDHSFMSVKAGTRPLNHKSLHPPSLQPGRAGTPHSLVHMIGGVLSIAQNRASGSKGMPINRINEKPPSLICGDAKPKEFTIPTPSSEACMCGKKEDLYKLPCKHILCRPCLQLAIKENKCLVCKNNFRKSDVTKHHLESMYGNKCA